jgi:nicotinamidase-related amidase
MTKVGLIVMDIHDGKEKDHPDLHTMFTWLAKLQRRVTQPLQTVLVTYNDWLIHPQLLELFQDAPVFNKEGHSILQSGEIAEYIFENELHALAIAGFSSRCCIPKSANHAVKNDFHVITSPQIITDYNHEYNNGPQIGDAMFMHERSKHFKHLASLRDPWVITLPTIDHVIDHINALDLNTLPKPKW